MSGAVALVKKIIPNCCCTNNCNKDGCNLSFDGAPTERVLIDTDCKDLGISANDTRCDYLFFGQLVEEVSVVPIELKSGGIGKVSRISMQLQSGADMADNLLPANTNFLLAPVLAHGKRIHKDDLRVLRKMTIKFRGRKEGIKLLRCRDPHAVERNILKS